MLKVEFNAQGAREAIHRRFVTGRAPDGAA